MRMSTEARARLVFAAGMVAIAGAAGAWYAVSERRFQIYEIRSGDAVSGLIAGAPVEFHGVEMGKVREVQLIDARNVRILLDLRKDAPVTTSTVATITGRGLATRGFTGYVYVNLEEGPTRGGPLAAAAGQRYPVIATAPSRSVNLDTSISDLNDSVREVTALLNSVLDRQTVASLKQSIASLDEVTRTLAANNQRLGNAIVNAEAASAQLQPLLRSSTQAVASLQTQVLPQATRSLVKLDGLSTSVNARLSTILQNTEQASTRLEPLLQSSTETVDTLQTQLLPQARRTLTRLDHISGSLDEAADNIRRSPSLLLRGTSPVQPGPGEAAH